MQTYKFPHFSFTPGTRVSVFLMLWAFGIILGTFTGNCSSAQSVSLMRHVLTAPVSIVGLLICAALPFAFTAAAVLSGKPWLVYCFTFLKGFAFSYTGSLCLLSFGSSGWLVRVLLLFSQIAIVPALWYVWLSLCKENMPLNRWGISLLSSYLVSIVLLDYFVVAPYLEKLCS